MTDCGFNYLLRGTDYCLLNSSLQTRLNIVVGVGGVGDGIGIGIGIAIRLSRVSKCAQASLCLAAML